MAYNLKKTLPPLIFTLHLFLHIFLGARGWTMPFELFNLMLLLTNFVVMIILMRGSADFLLGTGVMILIAGHGLLGQKLAPDSLSSGAVLTVNILTLYVGIKIWQNLPCRHFAAFAISYLLLFYIFILRMQNAEALFLLALLGLAATARSFKLLAYFWALVASFSFCQPYSWEALIISFFFLKVMFSLRGKLYFPAAPLFLVSGLLLLFLVLLPTLALMIGEDSRSMMNILKLPEVRDAIRLTAITATISTAILAAFCVPLAYALSRLEFFGKTFLLSAIDIPIIIPQSAAGIAILKVFGSQQFLGETIFNFAGIRFDGTAFGICLAQIFVGLPFIMKGAVAAFDSVPPGLEQCARTLGASSFGAFWRVALPLAAKGVAAAAVLAWARAAGEFGAVLFVAPFPETAPISVYNRFTAAGLVETAPLVAALLFFSLALFFLLQWSIRLLPSTRREED